MWGAFDDIVMGGVSESIFQIDRIGGENGLFGLSSSGVVSTENNGGFASIRTKVNSEVLFASIRIYGWFTFMK